MNVINNPAIDFKDFQSQQILFQNNFHLNNNVTLLPRNTLTNSQIYLKKKPAYIFHHFMKCGGTSIAIPLKKWFNIVYDHLLDPKDIDNYIANRYDVNNINSETCIIGHYAYDGTYLFQRYPEALTKKNIIKAFTFIRNPLSFNISFYYYSRSQGRLDLTLIDFIDSNRDLLAYYLPCDESNYKEVLDRYFFIGITERMQESFNKLATILNKRKISVPILNESERDSQISILTEDFIEKFKEKNKLDYIIYDYCLEKFNKI